MTNADTDVEYAGFWIRVGASLIDSLLIMIVITPLLRWIYGPAYFTGGAGLFDLWNVLLNYVLPAVAIVLFWVYRSATPGKMALRLRIVDARTGGKPSTGQLIGRYLGYYVSIFPLCLGFIWVGIDRRKQGWHDKLAGTVVLRDTRKEAVSFDR